jgi:hypothetical protein
LDEDYIKEVVNGGVKEVNQSDSIHRQMRAENLVPRIIKESIKNIYPDKKLGEHGYNWSDEFDAGKVIKRGEKVII